MATILGIESTCDETAAAVVVDGYDVRGDVVATQVQLHAKYRGVVPEIASRAHIENILPVVREALDTAGCDFADLDAVAVAHRPGLVGSLLIGVTAAKTLAWALGKPLIGVDHVHAHLYSVMLGEVSTSPARHSSDEAHSTAQTPIAAGQRPAGPPFPALGLVVSGGHTAMYRVNGWDDVTMIGTTIDDAVGEAYDKVAAILGLGYPGGPLIDRLAPAGDPRRMRFPRAMLSRESLDFSFSGLKTAVLYAVRGVPGRGETKSDAPRITFGCEEDRARHHRDVAAGFQAACVDVLVKKLRRGLDRTGAKSVIVGGGVSANRGLREALAHFDVPVHFPPMRYCTDNAAMIAGLADLAYRREQFASLDLDAVTNSGIAVTARSG